MMKKWLLVAAVCTSLVSLAASAGSLGHGSHKQFKARLGGPVVYALHRVDLSSEQIDAIHSIVEQGKENNQDLRASKEANAQAIFEIAKADTLDQAALEILADEQAQLAAQKVVAHATILAQVLKELTPEQMNEVEALLAERQMRRAKYKAKYRSGQ